MLFNRLGELTEGQENFAYICRFDRDTRTKGEEKLFLTSREPLVAVDSVKDLFTRLSEHAASREIPFFVSYDAVSEFYPVEGIKRSDWPMAAALIPDRVLTGHYDRTEGSAVRRSPDPEYTDPEMLGKIAGLRERIIDGELLQIVISRRFNIDDIEPFEFLRSFMEGDRSLYVYYYRIGEYEIMGSSPENVVSRHGRLLEVHPIAGTRRRGETHEEDQSLAEELLRDPKELREHRMLVDLARNDLGAVSETGSVKVVKSMVIQKFASVQHIVSTVNSTLRRGLGNYDIIRSVFPAGTVSGAPKVRAITLINQYEDVPRGPYAGGIGTFTDTSLEMALMIRTAYRKGNVAYTQAGGGIVMDSVPENEVREQRSKAATIMGALNDAGIDN